MQTAVLAMAGRIEESKSLARRLLELEPGFRVRRFVEFFVPFARPEIVDAFAQGLRESGLLE
jgi:hypothetical protein